MGDVVELILAVEQAFAVTIEDEEAEQMATLGDLEALVGTKLRQKWGEARELPCPNLQAFGRARRVLLAECGVARPAVRPSTTFDALLPRQAERRARQKVWHALSEALDVPLPELQPSRMAQELIEGALLLAIILTEIVWLGLGFSWGVHMSYLAFGAVIGFLLSLGLLVAGAEALETASGRDVPAEVATLGKMTRFVATRHYAEWARSQGGWNQRQVWDALCAIVADEAGIARDRVRRDSHLVFDLDFD